MDFLIQKTCGRTGATQHELLLQKIRQFNFKATVIGIVRRKNWNSFVRFR